MAGLVAQCNEAEDWLFEGGSEAGYREYQTKTYELQAAYSKLKHRKQEHTFRQNQLPEAISGLK